jgi:hypothetical protein
MKSSAKTTPVAAPIDLRYEKIARIMHGESDFIWAYIQSLAVTLDGRIDFKHLLQLGWNQGTIGALSAGLQYYVAIGKITRVDSDSYLIK